MLVVMDGEGLWTILNALPELGRYLVVNVGLGIVLRVLLILVLLFLLINGHSHLSILTVC